MASRTWVTRRADSTAKTFAVSPARSLRGSSGSQVALVSSSTDGWPSTAAPSSEACDGKFPVKNAVSMTTPATMPGAPSRTTAQSCPGLRRRRVSQPSYSLPR
jgi:hypothetical protein